MTINWRAAVGIAVVTLGFMFVSPAQGQTKEELYVKSIAATCASCHGTDGKAAQGSALVGLSKDHIVIQMKAFKLGTRPATIMHQLSKGYSDTQIEQIAAYFAAQK